MASVPDPLCWTVAVMMVGVFFTIVSAPVSYPAMVFWMSIALRRCSRPRAYTST